MSYQAGNASGFFLAGTIIQSLAMINYPEYDAPNWQSTMCVLAVVVISGIFNIWLSNFFPLLNNISMVLHVTGFVAVVVVLWVLAPHAPAHEVLLNFTNEGGWSSIGLSLMIGQISAIAGLGCRCDKNDTRRMLLTPLQAPTPPRTWPRKSQTPVSPYLAA